MPTATIASKTIKNMKRMTALLSFMVSILTIANSFCVQAQDVDSASQAQGMIKRFYISYITDVDKGETSKLDALQKKVCTARLLQRIPKLADQLDADPFLKAQDSNIKFLKSLTVKEDLKKEGHYIVSYGIDEKVVINLMVVKQDGNYKIDNVW